MRKHRLKGLTIGLFIIFLGRGYLVLVLTNPIVTS